ncbi:type II toxin-antitoxin system PemK/MazF family toxin [Streptococcus sp. E17BB]|uniref:type II toxin-antitoxin system PemK/MazF family toxin n=1 Tax=Streptococcus sp. E17BB TaxID=3278714 RepID=UPI00359DBE0B
MDRQEDLELLSQSAAHLVELIKRNPHYHKSFGMGESLSNYVNQLERDIKKQRRRYKKYLPGTIVYVHFGMNFGEEFSKKHYAITLSKNDNKSKRTITVVPLTSKNGKDKLKLDFNFSSELFYLTYKVAMDNKKKTEEELINEINSSLPPSITPVTSFDNLVYLFENQDKYNDLLQKIFHTQVQSVDLLKNASNQMDRFQRTKEKITYAALDCITTIDKNKIEPRLSEIDVLSATVLGDEQLQKLSLAISERII